MAVSGSGARNKGSAGEREFCSILEPCVDFPVQRNIDQVRDGGADIIAVRPFAIEVKRQENVNLTAWWEQALSQTTRTNTIPVLVWRQARKPWNVRMRVNDLVRKKMQPRKQFDTNWCDIQLGHFLDIVRNLGKE